MRQDAQGFACGCVFSSLARYSCPGALSRRNSTAASEKAHLRWALPILLPEVPDVSRRFLSAFDQTAVRDKILHAREAVDVVDFIEQHEAEDLADPGTVWSRDRFGRHVLRGFQNREFQVSEQRIIIGNQRQVDFDSLMHGRVGKAFSDPSRLAL